MEDYDDLNGNMLTKTDSLDASANMTFEYDALNQMVRANQDSVTKGLYDYNAGGLRVRHRLSERGDVDYFYDGNAVIEERNAADSSLLAHYRYADRLLSLNNGTSSQYYHHDALGSTVNLTDSVGTVQVSYSLDPWGTIRNQTGTSVNRQIFTGQEYDENTGLIYFGARYYDSETARFISQDSYLGEYGTPPSLHRYLYAYHNPTVFVDPTGYLVERNFDYFFDQTKGSKWLPPGMQSPLIRETSKITGAEPWDLETGFKQALSDWGFNKDNAVNAVALVIENGKGGDDVKAEVFDYLGEGFKRAYYENEDLREVFDARFSGGKAGDIINMSDFWQIAVDDSLARAAMQPGSKYWQDVYFNNGNGTVPLASKMLGNANLNSILSTDELAPPSLQREGMISTAFDLALIAGPPLIKAVRAGMSTEFFAEVKSLKNVGASKKPDIVYRRLHPGERYTASSKGLSPRSEGSNITPEQHILGVRDTPYISTTRDYNAALSYNRNATPIVEIDLSKVHGNVVDFTKSSNLSTLTNKKAIYNATRDAEVLIHGDIPAEAIGKVHFP